MAMQPASSGLIYHGSLVLSLSPLTRVRTSSRQFLLFQQAAVELTLPGIACEPGVLPAKFRKNDLPPYPSPDAGKLNKDSLKLSSPPRSPGSMPSCAPLGRS